MKFWGRGGGGGRGAGGGGRGMAGPARRGPRVGDAVSLWNFTPSPGFTQAEALVLKHSLAKFGVGRWQEILQSGVLPGKTIQQMNCQTQRLLGQQSLAAYTGLRVDIDRIRADNAARTDAERKNGLVINSGPTATPAVRRKWQAEARGKYGLSPEQVAGAEAALEGLLAGMAAGRGAGGGLDGGTAAGAAETILSVDPEGLSDLERGKLVLMLQAYVDSLNQLVRGLGATGGGPPPPPAAAEAEVQAPAQGRASAETARKGASGSGEESPRDEGKGKRRRQAGDRGAQKEKSARVAGVEASPGAGGGGGTAGKEAPTAAAASGDNVDAFKKGQLQQIVAMGFPKATARKALEKHGYDVEAAVHWIVVNTC